MEREVGGSKAKACCWQASLSPIGVDMLVSSGHHYRHRNPHFCSESFSLTGWLPVAGNVGLTITVRQDENEQAVISFVGVFYFYFFISCPTGGPCYVFVLTTSQSAGLSRMRENETDAVLVGPPEINVEEDFEAAAVGFW